ncbi:MAG: hypothetical protein CBC58_01130 [Cellulomonadaceae bacterium TMED98]|nr:MAG: hypothetical protein CBC58_01130 [Cellulomonadaceae bacterium TMED98]
MVTESDQLARALDDAAELWPELGGQRGKLLQRVVEAGMQAVHTEHTARQNAREHAVLSAAGSLSGVWPGDWHEQVRSEWPA